MSTDRKLFSFELGFQINNLVELGFFKNILPDVFNIYIYKKLRWEY
jgi:hypothetical protein